MRFTKTDIGCSKKISQVGKKLAIAKLWFQKITTLITSMAVAFASRTVRKEAGGRAFLQRSCLGLVSNGTA